jgi:hypothetical protein
MIGQSIKAVGKNAIRLERGHQVLALAQDWPSALVFGRPVVSGMKTTNSFTFAV